uniref:H92F n=1 Tax=Human herpesvirus 6B TaxID=32604 RepID=O57158_HHV6H|nr:H92F [Human betaherpesvirus 6B]
MRIKTLKAANGATAVSVFLIKLKVSGYCGWGLSYPG